MDAHGLALGVGVVVQVNERAGVGVQSRGDFDLLELFVLAGLQQPVFGGGAVEVGNQVQPQVRGGGDAEGLLHESVGLVPVPLGGGDQLDTRGRRRVSRLALGLLLLHDRRVHKHLLHAVGSSALHLAVGEKGSRHSGGAPGLAICPSSHSGLAFIPHKHRTRSD